MPTSVPNLAKTVDAIPVVTSHLKACDIRLLPTVAPSPPQQSVMASAATAAEAAKAPEAADAIEGIEVVDAKRPRFTWRRTGAGQ
jgi:hypothetical protein